VSSIYSKYSTQALKGGCKSKMVYYLHQYWPLELAVRHSETLCVRFIYRLWIFKF